MAIFQDDIEELKRLATNTYENDKVRQIHRIIHGINELKGENQSLKIENQQLLSKIETLEKKK
jgi:FtsZ-binding cell division protein ZapB